MLTALTVNNIRISFDFTIPPLTSTVFDWCKIRPKTKTQKNNMPFDHQTKKRKLSEEDGSDVKVKSRIQAMSEADKQLEARLQAMRDAISAGKKSVNDLLRSRQGNKYASCTCNFSLCGSATLLDATSIDDEKVEARLHALQDAMSTDKDSINDLLRSRQGIQVCCM